MKNPRNIERAWRAYEAAAFAGINPGPTQRRETEQAFYAGAASLFAVINQICESPDPDPSAVELSLVAALADEIEEFGEELADRAADRRDALAGVAADEDG